MTAPEASLNVTAAISVNVVVQSPTGTCLYANRTALDYWGLTLGYNPVRDEEGTILLRRTLNSTTP